MPIRPELRPLYPAHWRELSRRVRFERAEGRCQRCGRPHLVLLRCLPDGRWFDEQAATWRERRGRPAPWIPARSATRLREADLDILSKLSKQGLKWRLEPEAFTGREVGREDDLLDFPVGCAVDIEVARQPSA